jgi:2-methylcitrate dehydratase PrpD
VSHEAHFAGLCRAPAIGDEARAKARLMILDTVGCMLAARTAPEVSALETQLNLFEPGAFAFPGGPGLSTLGAAAVGAVAATWDEACEGLALAHGRPGVPVIAALLPQVLARNATVGAFAESLVAGYEVGARAGAWLRIRPGMHVDGNWPSLGVAAAVAHLAGLSAEQKRIAIDTAACQLGTSLYLPVATGATARNTYLAHSAWLGTLAALSASAGISAPGNALMDYAVRFAGEPDPVASTDRALILDAYLKPHAAVRHVHYGAEAARSIRSRLTGKTEGISALRLRVYREAMTYCGNRNPQVPIQAQFSLTFGVAAALVHDGIDPDVYRERAFRDPELRRLEALVQVEVDESLTTRGATLTVEADGRTHEARVGAIKGDPGQPVGPEEAVAKFLRYAGTEAAEFADTLLSCKADTPFGDVWAALDPMRPPPPDAGP